MKRNSVYAVAVIALLFATLLLLKWTDRRHPENLAQPLEAIPQELDGWTADASRPLSAEVLRVLLPTSYLSRDYRKNNQHLGLFIAYYAQQRAGETMHSPKNCLPGAGWEIWKHEFVDIPSTGNRFSVNKYFIQNAGQRLIVFYWYQSRERIIADEYWGKLLLIRDGVMEQSTSGSFVRVVVGDDPNLARQATQFSAGLIPRLARCFGRLKQAST